MNNEIEHMQVRLFRKACRKWNMDIRCCADLFDAYEVDKYIADLYEFFHVQGDDANLKEIKHYLKSKGAAI